MIIGWVIGGIIVIIAVWLKIKSSKSRSQEEQHPSSASTTSSHGDGHGASNHGHGEHSSSSSGSGWKLATIILTVVVLATAGYYFYSKYSEMKEAESSDLQPSQIPPVVIIQQLGKSKTYYFAEYTEGIIRVTIRSNARFYPKGGKVKITPPYGEPYIDIPGEHIERPHSLAGNFIFSVPKDSKASAIEIVQGVVE